MPRRLRIEFEDAIYHVMARGNARQKIVRDDADRRRLIEGLEQAAVRYGWELLCYVIMGNHLHLLLKTPRPNLGAGMQSFLSGFAIWAGRRWRRVGHLFQGRYRAEMIEDESYYWTVSRYIHLNPVRAGLVQRPEQWAWSSYPGYRDARPAQSWIAHDQLLAAWQGNKAVGILEGRKRAGSPRAVTRPGFPQIRTCPSTRHPAPHLMTSLRCSPSRGLPGRGEDCIAPPDERIWTTAFVCLGGAETATVARSRVQPPGIPGGCRSCQ
jgi:REP element-mobilizing transposase RayT